MGIAIENSYRFQDQLQRQSQQLERAAEQLRNACDETTALRRRVRELEEQVLQNERMMTSQSQTSHSAPVTPQKAKLGSDVGFV